MEQREITEKLKEYVVKSFKTPVHILNDPDNKGHYIVEMEIDGQWVETDRI